MIDAEGVVLTYSEMRHNDTCMACRGTGRVRKKCPHCGKAIHEHEAGRCLDAWFAEVVMGHLLGKHRNGAYYVRATSHGLPLYSTEIAAAWQGLDTLMEFGKGAYWWNLKGAPRVEAIVQLRKGDDDAYAYADTAPLAIVRACIKAKLAEQEKKR